MAFPAHLDPLITSIITFGTCFVAVCKYRAGWMDARTRRMLVLREFATEPEAQTALKKARGQVIAELTSRTGNGELRLTDVVSEHEADDGADG